MLYLVGLGLRDGDIAQNGVNALKDADAAFAELYTNSIHYDLAALEEETGTEITILDRSEVEDEDRVLEAAQDKDVAFLVSGDPLTATTHQDILFRAREAGIETDVIHAPSVLTAITETGLSIYKFGRTTTLPEPYKGDIPDSPFDVIDYNLEAGLHTLLLLDIGMTAEKALSYIEDEVAEDVLLCAKLGTQDRDIRYGSITALKEVADEFDVPCSIIVPADLSDPEQERLETFRVDA